MHATCMQKLSFSASSIHDQSTETQQSYCSRLRDGCYRGFTAAEVILQNCAAGTTEGGEQAGVGIAHKRCRLIAVEYEGTAGDVHAAVGRCIYSNSPAVMVPPSRSTQPVDSSKPISIAFASGIEIEPPVIVKVPVPG